MVHDFTAAPFIKTVQAPQYVVSHPICVPVSSRSSRRNSTSKHRGSTTRECSLPLTRTWTETFCALSGIDVADLHLSPSGPLKSCLRRTFDQRVHHLPLIFSRTAHIRLGIGGCTRGLCCRFDKLWCNLLATQQGFSFSNSNWQQTDAAQSDRDLSAAIAL